MGRAGFSLIQSLITIVMLSMIARFAVPRLDYGRFRVNADVRSVAGTLAYAQRLAVSLQHNVLVTINSGTGQVVTIEDKNDDGAYTAGERVRGFSLSEGVVFARNGAPDLPSPNATNEVTTITFWRDGSASSAGVVFLTTARAIADASSTDSRAIAIVRATGRPNWFTFADGAWRQGV
jgi:Tfp pilus assembly protein FimT